mgnify:FL=1
MRKADQPKVPDGPKLRRSWSRVPLAALVVALLSTQQGLAQQTRTEKGEPLARFQSSLTRLPDTTKLTLKQYVYVPVFSSVLGAAGLARLDLAVTLSIRNVSERSVLAIERIDYYDTAGKLIERYLDAPVAVRPLGTIEIYIPAEDVRGGTGANFIVGWAAVDSIAEPVIDALMTGLSGTRGFAFVISGRPIRLITR